MFSSFREKSMLAMEKMAVKKAVAPSLKTIRIKLFLGILM